MDWFDLLLLILASFRLTHLLVFDSIAEPLRKALRRVPFAGSVIECYWCAGIWVSLALYAVYLLWFPLAQPVVIILAIAAGQAFLESMVTRE